MAAIPVIVIQTNHYAFMECDRALRKAGLTDGRDFIINDGFFDYPKAEIVEKERQLLVTGSFYGDDKAAADYVREMKDRNPDLNAWFFSVMPPRENDRSIFDRTIPKRDGSDVELLVQEILKFLNQK